MIGILIPLVGGILVVDWKPQQLSSTDYLLLRAPFSLHAGWIIAASALNTCVLAEYLEAAPDVSLALSMLCFCGILLAVALFAFASPKPDVIIPLVAAWALTGIFAELGQPDNLMNPTRFNFFAWPQFVISGVRVAAAVLAAVSIAAAAAVVAAGFISYRRMVKSPREDSVAATTGDAQEDVQA